MYVYATWIGYTERRDMAGDLAIYEIRAKANSSNCPLESKQLLHDESAPTWTAVLQTVHYLLLPFERVEVFMSICPLNHVNVIVG